MRFCERAQRDPPFRPFNNRLNGDERSDRGGAAQELDSMAS
jgi:hypothetical protein